MREARQFPSDVAFSAAVKEVQERKGSRRAYSRMELGHGWRTRIEPELAAFIQQQRSFFLGTASASGQPTSSTAADRPAFCACWMSTGWRLRTSAAIGSTSAKET